VGGVNKYAEAAEKLFEVGEGLVEAAGLEPGMEVLDVGTGTGNVALPAGKRGARVIGLDPSGELLAIARERAADAMLELDWHEGDLERLPFDEHSFDRVLSAFGHMFEPDHEAMARELKRVCRPEGAIGLCAWTPEGVGGRTLAIVADHVPPPDEYQAPPHAWGSEDHLRELLGGELEAERHTVIFEDSSAEAWVDFLAQSLGPFISAREGLSAADWGELRKELAGVYRDANGAGDGALRFEQEYLLAIIRP
jgi:SAM-dependent methyltransferase